MEELIKKLKEGVELPSRDIIRGRAKKGRFAQEINFDLYVLRGGREEFLMHAKLFRGRGVYKSWIELFGLKGAIFGEGFFGSELEGYILDLFSPYTGRLFVEYFEDKKTAEELKRGIPPALSRLGFELAKRGFTYVRDWYIPEGLMEGGHKLQGEKPPNGEVQERRVKRLREELSNFLKGHASEELKDRARERFKILEDLWKQSFL